MPIVMISMVISETSNYMNVMIVQNVSEKSMYELQFKTNKKMKNYNWEYFKSQINKKLSEPETKISTVKEKLMWNLFWIYEGYFGFHSDVCPRTQ